MSKITSFLNGVFRIAWGFIFDWLGFRIPYSIVTANQILVSTTFYFSARNKYTYLVANILENLSFAGHGTIAPPIVTKIFGMKNAIILIGITGYFIGSCGFIGAVLAKLIIKKRADYIIVYLIGAGFAIMAFIICLNLSESKFRYIKIDPPGEQLIDPRDTVKPLFSNEVKDNANAEENSEKETPKTD